jgi:hypothetical protein
VKGVDYFTEEEKAAMVEEVTDAFPDVLREDGIVKQDVLPIGFPYANDELIFGRASAVELETQPYSVQINRKPQIGELCLVVCETQAETFIVEAIVQHAGSSTCCRISTGNPDDGTYKNYGSLYFTEGRAFLDFSNGEISYFTVFVSSGVTKISNRYMPDDVEAKSIILPSSTSGSSKRFKITVNDSGTLTAVEV